MTDRFVRFAGDPLRLCWLLLACTACQTSTAFAQSIRLAGGSGASSEVVPANEPRAHLNNLSNALWTKTLESETPTRPPIRLISGYTRYPFGQYGAHGRYPFGTQYYYYGPTLSYRSYGQYPVPRTAAPPVASLPVLPWGIGGYGPGYWPGYWGYGWNGYGWNGYGYGGYGPVTWSYGGWGAPVPAGWGPVPVAPTWGPVWPGW